MQITVRFLGIAVAVLGLMVGAAGSARAEIQLAYINASGGDVSYLSSYGINVTDINNPVGLTLADLSGYNAIMIASSTLFSEPTTIGNVAAQFANAGGGVVLTVFDFQGKYALGGTIMTAGYSPFSVDPSNSGYHIPSGLGTIYNPSSPLFNGVNTSNVKTDFQANVGVTAGATLVADWSITGRPAIGFNSLASSSVVGLNLFPDSSYTSNADTQALVANAIIFSTTTVSTVPEPSTFLVAGLAGLLGIGYGWRRGRQRAAR